MISAVAARRHRGGPLEEPAAPGVARRGRARARRRPTRRTTPPLLIAPPTTQRPGRQRVAEEPRRAGSVDGPLDHEAQRAAGADRAGGDARAHGADAEVGQRPVAGAGDDGRSRPASPSSRAAAAVSVEARGRGHELGELLGADPGERQRLGVPVASRRRSISPVPEATEWSHGPGARSSRCSTSSLIPAPARAPARTSSGSCSREPASLASGAIGCSGVPVRAVQAGVLARAARSACAAARVSAQVSRAVSGRPSASSAHERCASRC